VGLSFELHSHKYGPESEVHVLKRRKCIRFARVQICATAMCVTVFSRRLAAAVNQPSVV
jgi:hypothetical protein